MSGDKLPPFPKTEVAKEMVAITCDGCGRSREVGIQYINTLRSATRPGDSIHGVFVCVSCGHKSPFEVTEDRVTFKPGGNMTTPLNAGVPVSVTGRYDEAHTCWFAGAYRGAAVLARSVVETSLEEKGIRERNLEASIDKAKTNGLLGDEEYSIAQGSRLIGNHAIHKADDIKGGQVAGVLSAAATIVNHIWP